MDPNTLTDDTRFERFLSRSFLALIAIVLTFVFLEIVSNVYLLYSADDGEFMKYASLDQLQARQPSAQYTAHRYLWYYPTPNYVKGKNRHSARGYRGKEISIPKPSTRFRIVCLGGSTTYTTAVQDHSKTYPSLLEEYLRGKGAINIEVVNAGAGGWSSCESLINLELRVLDLDPDLIIVYHGINDIHPRFVWPPEAYRGDYSGSRAPQSELFMPSIMEYSTLLRMLMIRAGVVNSHATFERTIDKSPDTYYGNLFFVQRKTGIYPNGLFEEVSARRMLDENQPVYFERNIRNMVAIAKDRRIEMVISSFAYSTLFPDWPRAVSEEFVFAHEENNALLRKIAEETGVQFFDFASKFPTAKKYYVDGRHVNEEGAQLKAELFGEFLIQQKLVPVNYFNPRRPS